MDKQVEDRLKKLEDTVRFLTEKRIAQVDILPDSVKMRHVGEGVRFIRGGATASKPTKGEGVMQGYAIYFDTTAKKLYIWNSDATTPAWNEASFT